MQLSLALGSSVRLNMEHKNIHKFLQKEDAMVVLKMINYLSAGCECVECDCNGLKYKIKIVRN